MPNFQTFGVALRKFMCSAMEIYVVINNAYRNIIILKSTRLEDLKIRRVHR